MGPIFTMRTSPSSTTVSSGSPTPCRRFGTVRGAQRRLVCALLCLVSLALGNCVHVRQGRMVRGDLLPSGRAHAELLGDNAHHDAGLGGAEAGQCGEAA